MIFHLFVCSLLPLQRQIGPVSKVWTEREMLERAAYEFEQVKYKHSQSTFFYGNIIMTRIEITNERWTRC